MSNVIWSTTNDTDWGTSGNWSTGSVPVNSDNVFLERSTIDVAGSLDQSSVALTLLHIRSTMLGKVGTIDSPLQIGTSRLVIGDQQERLLGGGSTRINVDLGSATACNAVIFSTAVRSSDTGLTPVRLLANNSSTNVRVDRGQVSIAPLSDDTSTVGVIQLGLQSSKLEDVWCYVGRGVTWTTLNATGGRCLVHSAGTTINIYGGEVTSEGTHAITTVNIYGGSFVHKSSGTVTTVNMYGGMLDLQQSSDARTITNVNLLSGAPAVKYHPSVTLTNKLNPSYLVNAGFGVPG